MPAKIGIATTNAGDITYGPLATAAPPGSAGPMRIKAPQRRLSIAPQANVLEVNVPQANSVINRLHHGIVLSSFLPTMGAHHARSGLHVRST
jgi:hypothetical protein